MKKTIGSVRLAVLLSLGFAPAVGAQADTASQTDDGIQTAQADTADDEGGDDGKWGLLGLAGLARRDRGGRTGTNR